MANFDVGDGAEELTFRDVSGDTVLIRATLGPDDQDAPEFLAARTIRPDGGAVLRQLRVKGTRRRAGYERLDNEILAGLRLDAVTEGRDYPEQLSRLRGYDADSADPFVLLEDYQGMPLSTAAGQLDADEQFRFQIGLLNGLCWLAAAGIAHRGITPRSVRWDSEQQQVQLTDFSLCTVFGAAREPIGKPPWAALEQRAGRASGHVSDRDDIWAAGRLIFYVQTQEELSDPGQLAERPALQALLEGVFGPPEGRPSARELLKRLKVDCQVPRALDGDTSLQDGRDSFYELRQNRHPGAAPPRAAGGADAAGRAEVSTSPQPPAEVSAAAGEASAGRRRLRRMFPSTMSLAAGGAAVAVVLTRTALAR